MKRVFAGYRGRVGNGPPKKNLIFVTKYGINKTSVTTNGAVAQLGARLTGSQKVVGSTPISSIFFIFWEFFLLTFFWGFIKIRDDEEKNNA